MTHQLWHCGRFQIDLSTPRVMAVVNLTSDSFSDGGQLDTDQQAIARAWSLIDQGADIIDLGAESTRPGALRVEAGDQMHRLLPVVRALRDANVAVSVDTSDPEVMRAVLGEGASIINDVRALTDPHAIELIAAHTCGVVLTHMQGDTKTMQHAPGYLNASAEVFDFLIQRRELLRSRGVESSRIALDPGFGFGKLPAHNWQLLHELQQLANEGPVLVGLSRKSMIGQATGKPVGDRMVGSVVAAVLAILNGASVVRVHDVPATREAIAVLRALQTHCD